MTSAVGVCVAVAVAVGLLTWAGGRVGPAEAGLGGVTVAAGAAVRAGALLRLAGVARADPAGVEPGGVQAGRGLNSAGSAGNSSRPAAYAAAQRINTAVKKTKMA